MAVTQPSAKWPQLHTWETECPNLPGAAVALALRATHRTAAHLRELVDVDIA